MLLIFGLKGYVRQLAIVMLVCQNCGNPAAHRVEERTKKFTLFFVPLFQVSRKQSLTCTFCGQTTKITADQAARYGSMGAGTSSTIEPAPRA
jgi:transcription elongation factor Elf1